MGKMVAVCFPGIIALPDLAPWLDVPMVHTDMSDEGDVVSEGEE